MKIENTIAIITGGAQGLGKGFAEGLMKNGAKCLLVLRIMKVQDKVAIVTGGAQGLGKGFAEVLLTNGASVVIVDLNEDGGIRTLSELAKSHGAGRCTFIKGDVTKLSDLQNVFSKTKEVYGNIDILVNNAGIYFSDESAAGHEGRGLLIDIDMKAVVECSYLALDYMRKDKGGRGGLIVNMASVVGLIAHQAVPVYTAAKHAIVGLTKALGSRQADVIDQGIRVSCLCPNIVRTPTVESQMNDSPAYKQYVQASGLLEISEVADIFMKVVNNDALEAGVVLVSKTTAEVQYPEALQGVKL